MNHIFLFILNYFLQYSKYSQYVTEAYLESTEGYIQESTSACLCVLISHSLKVL